MSVPPRLAPFASLACSVLLAVGASSTPAHSGSSPLRADEQVALPEPSAHFGFELGTDGRLLTYEESIGYFEALDRASNCIELETIGTTSFGRELKLAWLGAAPLLAQKERVLEMLRDVADPRRLDPEREARILAECPGLLVMSMSMHSTEVGAALWAPQFAYELVSRDDLEARQVRENLLIALLPCTNPDGMTMVAEWFRERRAAGLLHAPLPRLYQRWAGHDNNRDWFMLNLPETRAITRQLYERLHPLVVLDMHQMGNSGPRFFVPPYADPVNPNLDPILTQALNLLGTRIAHDMTLRGCSGVVTSTVFDNWWNGGMRNVPFRHNVLGILTECASANLGDPIEQRREVLRGRGVNLPDYVAQTNHPDPWPGGVWSLAEILRYDREAAWSVLRTMAAEREPYLARKILLGRRALAAPTVDGLHGYRIEAGGGEAPGRAGAARRLVATLQALAVEVEALEGGGWWVPFAQPYRAMAKDLLEVQRYPELLDAPRPHGQPIRPYDAAGWTLPLQFGVRVHAMQGAAPRTLGRAERIALPPAPGADVEGTRPADVQEANGAGGSLQDPEDLRRLVALLRAGEAVWMQDDGSFGTGTRQRTQKPLQLLRVAVSTSHVANMDEGWTRYVLEAWQVPFVELAPEEIAKGGLAARFDVLLLPSIGRSTLLRGHGRARQMPRYAGGIGTEGLQALHAFVEQGGRLVAWGGAVDAVLPIPGKNVVNVLRGLPGSGFSSPSSVLRVFQEGTNDDEAAAPSERPGHAVSRRQLTEGLVFARPALWGVLQRDEVALGGTDLESLLTYPKKPLLSGYLSGEEKIALMSAYARVRSGKGEYLLMGFRPQNRGQTLATVPLLLRTCLRY